MRREEVLAPVVLQVAPDRVDVVGAVLGVVVLDDEARPADRVVVAAAGRLRARPGERDLGQAGIGDLGPGRVGDLRSDAIDVVPDQPLERRLPRRRRGPRDGCRPGRTGRRPAVRCRSGCRRAPGRRRPPRGARPASAPRGARAPAPPRRAASASPPARPARDDRRVRPEERRRRADHPTAGEREVDRDVMAADPPRPRRPPNPASPKTANQYSSGSRRLQSDRPAARSSSPRTVSRAMIAAISPGGSARSSPTRPRRRRRHAGRAACRGAPGPPAGPGVYVPDEAL